MSGLTSLADRHYKKFCAIVYREAGIYLSDDKQALLSARIAKRVRTLAIDPGRYLQVIENDPQEMAHFLNAISTHHTFFFRESRHFKHLDPTCRSIWCAAASSGEEPYSLAVYCLAQGFSPNILATDLSASCLEKGRRGIYPIERKREIPPQLLKTYFEKGQGRWSSYMRVKNQVRQCVTFKLFNLMVDVPAAQTFDAIFCRNVMIYFDLPIKEKVVHKLNASLKPGGLFIIGGSESLNGLKHNLKYVEPSVYRKV